jgi:opacity protein-like surface antigen
MLSSRLQFSILVVAVSFAAGSVHAADYSPPQCYDAALIASGRAPYCAVPSYVPPPGEDFYTLYLRGDIGISNQQVKSLDNLLSVPGTFTTPNGYGFDSAGIFGIGVGYYYNDWLRFDLTGEYRSRANFHGLEVFNAGYTDEYSGSKSEWLFLVNSYIDLGTWSGFTPFVGAGIGMSRNTIHGFQDVNTPTGGVAFAYDQSKWNFAWALHAGVSYKVTKNFTVELAYRYVNLGDAVTGDLIKYDGGNDYYNPTTFNHLTSHDIKLGLRFNFDGFGSGPSSYYAPAPVVYQPQVYQPAPVYAPPPVYVQPPLRSRG